MRRIRIKKYNKKFTLYFQKEKKIISKFGKFEIYHVGSTSVPDMSGKGEIDILIIAKSPKQRENLIKNLKKLRYQKTKTQRKERIFVYKKKGKMMYNLHIYTIKNRKKAMGMVRFRDFIKKDNKEARKYESLKKDIFKKAGGNRIKYRKLKKDYFRNITKKIEI